MTNKTQVSTGSLIGDIKNVMEMYPEEEVSEIVLRVKTQPQLVEAAKESEYYFSRLNFESLSVGAIESLEKLRAALKSAGVES